MKGKKLSLALAVFMMLSCSSVLAEMPIGTVIIDGKGYSLEYLNANPKEFRLGEAKSLLIKLPNGKWVDARSEEFIEKETIPKIEYKDEQGNIRVYAKEDGEILEEQLSVKKEEYQVIEVSNSEELTKAIGSNRKILLKEGLYSLIESQNEYVKEGQGYNQSKIVIDGVENLIIEGEEPIYENGKAKYSTRLGVDPKALMSYGLVNCKNITLKNIALTPVQIDKEWSYTSSLLIDNCDGVNIENMFMSEATMGMILRNSKKLQFKNINIEKTGVMVFSGYNLSDMSFIGCEFNDNKNAVQFVLSGCNNVAFEGCKFIDNDHLIHSSQVSHASLFIISDAEGIEHKDEKGVTFNKCIFKGNKQAKIYVNTSDKPVELIDNEFSENGFEK